MHGHGVHFCIRLAGSALSVTEATSRARLSAAISCSYSSKRSSLQRVAFGAALPRPHAAGMPTPEVSRHSLNECPLRSCTGRAGVGRPATEALLL